MRAAGVMDEAGEMRERGKRWASACVAKQASARQGRSSRVCWCLAPVQLYNDYTGAGRPILITSAPVDIRPQNNPQSPHSFSLQMDFLVSTVPEISISPAPPADPLVEPFSPFDFQPLSPAFDVQDGYRPSLLSPPPTVSRRFMRQSSPLRPADATGKGLDSARFEALLASTRERNAASGTKKTPDLRKEIALKAHKSKQMERRALFLSKVQAPPSPTATSTPKTPPESPAIFHYSLPSPGLNSPLALFETIGKRDSIGNTWSAVQPWVEQVDFRMPVEKKAPSSVPVTQSNIRSVKPMPSLDQITAHLSTHGNAKEDKAHRRSPIPLPAFLRSGSPPHKGNPEPMPNARSRLVFPTRQNAAATPKPVTLHAPTPCIPPRLASVATSA
ncbi:hypothetical protein EW146_g77 [Bondarzewia mesenterica]|uniref:Uncharacterized protein n=1 Tax=Bondarzewia mesenterica TaxID=1095465 RepID=A0A4S4M8B8_9AGAM|nr:hypothetical protein EW146_g77 [Bondarzewia mesenterica]